MNNAIYQFEGSGLFFSVLGVRKISPWPIVHGKFCYIKKFLQKKMRGPLFTSGI